MCAHWIDPFCRKFSGGRRLCKAARVAFGGTCEAALRFPSGFCAAVACRLSNLQDECWKRVCVSCGSHESRIFSARMLVEPIPDEFQHSSPNVYHRSRFAAGTLQRHFPLRVVKMISEQESVPQSFNQRWGWDRLPRGTNPYTSLQYLNGHFPTAL